MNIKLSQRFTTQTMPTAFTAEHGLASDASVNMQLPLTNRLLDNRQVAICHYWTWWANRWWEIQLELMHHQAEHMHTVDWLLTWPYTSTTIFLCTSRPPTIWQQTTTYYQCQYPRSVDITNTGIFLYLALDCLLVKSWTQVIWLRTKCTATNRCCIMNKDEHTCPQSCYSVIGDKQFLWSKPKFDPS